MFVESLFNSLLASLARPFISPLIRAFVKPFVSPFAGFSAGSFIRRLIRRLVAHFVGLFDVHFVSALSGLLFSCFGGAARASCVCAILAITAGAVALVAVLSASPVSHELDQAVRLSWWF
jgi:hypothetical protein